MFATAEAFQDIVVRLSVLRYVVTSNTRRGRHDIATDAENFFAGFLNKLFRWSLVNLNETEYRNYPAIDLADPHRKIAIQVTAENSASKIKETITTFYGHKLDASYDKLFVLTLSRKLEYTSDFKALTSDLREFDIWDIDDLLRFVEKGLIDDDLHDRDFNVIEALEDFTRRELPSIVRSLSADPQGLYPGLLSQLEVVIGHPPTSAGRFLDAIYASEPEQRVAGLDAITQLYTQLKDLSYIGTRQILAHAIQYSIDAKQFKWRFPNSYINLSHDALVFAPQLLGQNMNYSRQTQFWKQVNGLQFQGWASPLEDTGFVHISAYTQALDLNLFYYLKVFLRNDIAKLHAVLVNLDFRLLD